MNLAASPLDLESRWGKLGGKEHGRGSAEGWQMADADIYMGESDGEKNMSQSSSYL